MRPVIIFRFSEKLKRRLTSLGVVIAILVVAWFAGKHMPTLKDSWTGEREATLNYLMDKACQVFLVTGGSYQNVLLEAMPVLASTLDTQAMAGTEAGLESAWSKVTSDLQNPRSLLDSQMTILKMVNFQGEELDPEALGDMEEEYIPEVDYENLVDDPVPEPPPSDFIKSDKPVVAIYNTHNAETYIPTDGKSKLEGKNAGVAEVAERLAKVLEDKEVKTIRSTTIHDYPSFTKSYGNSLKTVQTMLAKNPSIQVVIDVHRDAGLTKKETTKINGKTAAKLLLVVGSNARAEHPNWEKNKLFADKVVKKMEELYPGLSKGYRVQSGRYNQHLHPNAITLEVGSDKNSQEEAEQAVILFADVLLHVLSDLQKEKL